MRPGPARFANNGASSKVLQAADQPAPEKEARVGAAQHHSVLWSAARGLSQHRPLQAATSAHAWLASHDGPSWQPDTPGIELRCCCVAASAQRFWAPSVWSVPAYSAVLVPPVHPTPLCRQLARSRMCAHRKGQPFSSAEKHKPDAVPHKACYDLNSPLVIPAREPQANLERHTNADMNAQQLSVLFRLLYCFLLQRRPAKYRWLVGIHQNESYFLCQLTVGPHFAIAHAQRTCQAQASMAGQE